jgi:uncharacterized protein
MQLSETSFGEAVPVDGYGDGFFRVGGKVCMGPLLMAGAGPLVWEGLDDSAPLLALAGEVDVLFFGMGAEIAFLPAPLRMALEEAGIGVELMASPSACRTYNVLLSEGRRVALAALPV